MPLLKALLHGAGSRRLRQTWASCCFDRQHAAFATDSRAPQPLLDAYNELLKDGSLRPDANQLAAAQALQLLQTSVISNVKRLRHQSADVPGASGAAPMVADAPPPSPPAAR